MKDTQTKSSVEEFVLVTEPRGKGKYALMKDARTKSLIEESVLVMEPRIGEKITGKGTYAPTKDALI